MRFFLELVRAAYAEMWNEQSKYSYGLPFADDRIRTRRAPIREKIPFRVVRGVDVRVSKPPSPPRPMIEGGGE